MAKRTEAERKQSNQNVAALLAKINEVTGTKNTAQTMQTELFKNAGLNVGIDSKTNAVTIDGKSVKDYQYRNEAQKPVSDDRKKAEMQKKKEDQADQKRQDNILQNNKAKAEKALADFDENGEFDATSARDRKRYDAEREQLQKAVDQAGAELAAREEAVHRQRDTEAIKKMKEGDRNALEQYAVNRVRDQNLPIELTGIMPTAEQEAADFTDKFGKLRAKELAETFMREENAKLAKQTEEAGRKFAEEHPVVASAATVPINLMSGLVGSVGQLQGAARATGRYGSLDANETGTALDKFSGAVRDQVAQDISGDVYDQNGNQVEEGGALRQIGSFAYQGGMSFLDSTARFLASGGVTGVSSTIAALGGFSQALSKYSAMGASPEQAAMAATASAGLEYITDKLPTDEVLKIFHKGGGTSAVKEVLKQAFLTEPLGEEVNLFAGIAAEAMILGEKSGKAQRIGDLIAGGMTKAEAEKQFWKETFGEAAQTYAVSAFSGLFGGGTAAIAGNQVQAGQEQQQIVVDPTAQMEQEAQPPIPTEAELAQLAMDDTAAGLQETAPVAEQTAPMTEPQQNLQMAMDDLMGEHDLQEQTTKAVTNPIDSYPPEKQSMIRSYIQAVDTKIKDFVQKVKSGDTSFKRQKIANVNDRAAGDISRILGIDVKGFTHNINTNGVQHIINRHTGKPGGHDNSMELVDDIARVGWVLENYDNVELLLEDGEQVYSSEFRDKNDNPAPQIRFVKKIDGNYYVVEAACENKHNKLWVQSAYLQKNNGDVTQAPAEGPSANHETNARSALASPSPINIVAENTPDVNGNTPTESDYYDEFEDFGTGGANRDEFLGRDWDEVGKRNVKAYMYENPEVKPYFQMEAQLMLMELADSTKGERTYDEDVHYESGGERGWSGVKRDTSEDIAYLLDTVGFSYADIEKGLNAIIEDNGAENNAASKRIEFILHNRLMNGHKDFYGDRDTYPDGRVPASDEYVQLINDKQITAYDNEPDAVGDNLTATASSPQTEDSGTMPAEGGQIAGPGAVEANFTGKVAYANLLQEGNVQPDRSGDVRPMEVPKTDGNGKRVTEFAANAYGAGATTDEMASTIESLIQDGELGFNVRTNRESLDNAAAVISKRGAAEARNQITRNISKGKIRDGDIEQGILLYARYAEKGDNDNASEMLVDLAQMANITGRNLQMFKLLRRMTVEGQVMTLEKEVRRSVESMIRSGQVKKGYEPSFDPQMMDGYRKALEELRLAKTPETQEAAKLKAKQTQEALYADAAAKMPATFKAKWDAWRYMAMLGNAKTQIRNLAGNAAFMPYKEVKDKMGALAEKVLVPKDQRTKSLTTDRGLLQWARDDRKNNESVRDALKYSAAIGDDVTSQKIRDDIKVFNTKALESLRGFVNKVPQAGDMLFKNGYYERSLAGFLRGRGYTAADIQSGKVTEAVLNEARSYAVQEAMKATFNDCNAFSDFLATELRYKGDNPVGKVLNIAAEGVLPFRRTPANIAVRFTEYSPVGVAKGLWNAATKVRSGEMTAATAIDQLTAGLTGSAVMALGYALAEGLGGVKITGSGTDEDEKRQGHQDYALEFSKDGQEYSYKIDWAAPANLPLFVGANIYSALNSEGNSQDVSAFTSFLRGMGTMFEPLLALSCMSSLNDLVEGVRYADEGEALYSMAASMATSYFTQGIPALARQNYQANQEYKQTTFTTSDDPSIRDLQKTAAGLGVSDAYKTDKVDAWGQKEYQGTKVDRNFNAFFNPGTLKKIDNSAVEQEITRLNNAGHNVSPNTAARTISYIDKDGYGHDEVRLTEEQFQTLAQTQGQTARKLVEDMISSEDYTGMTDAQKAEAIDTAYLYARKTGEIAAIDDHTGYDQTWMMDVNKRGANEILRRVLNSDLNGSMSDLDTAWDRGYEEENFSRALQSAFDSFSKATPAMQKQVYAEAEGTTRKYLEARSKGISHIDFLEVAESIAKVKGTGTINKDTGKATVRDIDRRKAIANTKGMTDKEIDIVMKAYMADYDPSDSSPETTEFKYQYAREELGLSPKEYTSTYQAYLDNSKKNQKIAAIRALGYDYRTANALYKLYYGRMKKDLIEMYG